VHDGAETSSSETEPGAELAQALSAAPLNSLSQAALQAYAALYTSVYPSSVDVPELRANYSGQVWSLLEAAEWAESPASLSTCQADPDRDGKPECILASEQAYAQFEINDGSLSFLFARDSGDALAESQQAEVHQLVAPSSQFITGLSDPAGWELQSGLRADPSVIPGAYSGPGTDFEVQIALQELRFTRRSGEYQKSYRLTGRGISLRAHQPPGGTGEPLKIPLALDPWLRFSPGWADRYSSRSTGSSYEWEASSQATIRLTTTSSFTAHDFRETRLFFGSEEDPNLDYPAGHFLPFPLALLEVENQGDFQVSISLLDAP
jgi:hypothetical protein